MLRWYLVRTKRAREGTAEVQLERQGYEVYLPRLVQSIKRGGRWRDRIAALFPGYLFVRVDEGQQALGPVRSTIGVTNVVRFGANYATVPDALVASLIARADTETGLHRLQTPSLPPAGSRVTVSNGPFDGMAGIYERECGEDRVLVLLNLLGQSTRVQLPIESIVPGMAA